jgi:glycosyltransferase involved in cell wall biosynthesis
VKVVFFRHSLLSRGGDKMIALHASHLARCGHEVVIMANIVDTVFTLDEAVRIELITFKGKLGSLISATFQKIDADLVIADIIPMACLLYMRSRRKVVYFAQDYDESYYSDTFAKGFVRSLYYLGLTLFQIQTISVSFPLANLLRDRFSAKAIVVENGVDTKIFYPDPDSGLIAAKGDRRAVLLFSRNDRRKGFDIAKAVVSRLIEARAGSLEVWTVGEPCSGIFSDSIHRDFGYVGENRLRKIMSSADMFLYPSRHEGFPLMVIEAFRCCCPTVTTRAVPYAVNKVNALVSDIEDVNSLAADCSLLLSDKVLKDHIVQQGFQYASGLSLSVVTGNFESALLKMV